MKTLFYKLLPLQIISIVGVNGQTQEGGLLYEKFEIRETVHYLIPDSTDAALFTEQDWVMLRPGEELRTETHAIDQDALETMSIQIVESSSAEDWEHMPLKIYSDLEGISIYDANEQLINFIPHSSPYLLASDSLRQFRLSKGIPVIYSFPQLNDIDQEAIMQAGAIITGNEEHYQIITATGEVEVNQNDLYIIERVFQPEFGVPYYSFTSFDRSSQGFLKPKLVKQLALSKTIGGFCVEKVHQKAFHNYEFYVDPEFIYSRENQRAPDYFSIYPNPVVDKLYFQTSPEIWQGQSDGEFCNVRLYDQLNELVFAWNRLEVQDIISVDLTSIPPGYYTLHLHWRSHSFIYKILKL